MIPLIILGILALALLGALIYLEMAHANERQALLDRIESPLASQAAATTRMLPPPAPVKVPEDPRVPVTDYDLSLEELLLP